ncbi:MAG: hypothetical protein ACJAS9_004087 [Polaribacter sp.]
MTSILKSIDNGYLLDTLAYDSNWQPDESRDDVDAQREANIDRYQKYHQILSLVSDEYVSGTSNNAPVNLHYTNLKLTKSGVDRLCFESLTLADIDNSSGKDSFMSLYGRTIIIFCVCGLIAFSSKWVWDNKISTDITPTLVPQKTSLQKNSPSEKKSPPVNKNLIKIDKPST